MKRFVGSSCFGLLFLLLLGGIVAVFVFTIVFQQSQATSSNATAAARPSATDSVTPMFPAPVYPTAALIPITLPVDAVTIQVDSPMTPAASAMQPFVSSDTPALRLPAATGIPLPSITLTDVPRNSGTSTYPLTETAEVVLAQTDVAHYESGIAATRTAIAAESQAIYATLTAAAPTASEAGS